MADQIGAPVTAFGDYARRDETRRAHLADLMQRFGFTAFDRNHFPAIVAFAMPVSASATEISAAVLKDARRGIVTGRTTNGSVLGALSYPLPDGGSVQVPVEDVEMLDGMRLEGRGCVPDVEVYPTIE